MPPNNNKGAGIIMFTRAIARTPSESMIKGITTASLGKPDYDLAIQQHQDYIKALEECGLEVTLLDADENFPDSTFVEDVALLTPACAIMTNPGAATRTREVDDMVPVVQGFYDVIEFIEAPGTVEAGDIMMVGDHYYIGLSARTNSQGAAQMIKHLQNHGMTGSMVNLSEVLHLKTGLGYLENNNLLACGEFLTKQDFKDFNLLEVDAAESYAANSVWINGTVLTPKGFPATKQLIESKGYKTREVDVSEYQKIDGGLSCLSLRF
jgi:dimethylargininase